MLHDDDLDPRTKKPVLRALDKMSVDELRDYAVALDVEKARVEAEIAKKQSHLAAADAVFGPRGA